MEEEGSSQQKTTSNEPLLVINVGEFVKNPKSLEREPITWLDLSQAEDLSEETLTYLLDTLESRNLLSSLTQLTIPQLEWDTVFRLTLPVTLWESRVQVLHVHSSYLHNERRVRRCSHLRELHVYEINACTFNMAVLPSSFGGKLTLFLRFAAIDSASTSRATEVLGNGLVALNEKKFKEISFIDLPDEIFSTLNELKLSNLTLKAVKPPPSLHEQVEEHKAALRQVPPHSLQADMLRAYESLTLSQPESGADVTFYLADKQTASAHRVLLMLRCPALLAEDVYLSSVHKRPFEIFLRYLYADIIDVDIPLPDVQNVHNLALEFGIERLVSICKFVLDSCSVLVEFPPSTLSKDLRQAMYREDLPDMVCLWVDESDEVVVEPSAIRLQEIEDGVVAGLPGEKEFFYNLPDSDDGCLEEMVAGVAAGSLRCPRFMLSRRSDYFMGKFNSHMTDASSLRLSVPKVADAHLLRELLCFILSDQATLSARNVIPLCYAADILNLPLLKELCASYVTANLSIETGFRFAIQSYVWSSLTDLCFDYFTRNVVELFKRNAIGLVTLDLQLFQAVLSYVYNYTIDLLEAANAHVIPNEGDNALPTTTILPGENNIYAIQAEVFHVAISWITSRTDQSQSDWKEEFFPKLKEFWPYVHINMLCEGDFAKSLVTSNTFGRDLVASVCPSVDGIDDLPCYYFPLHQKGQEVNEEITRNKGKEKERGNKGKEEEEDSKKRKRKETTSDVEKGQNKKRDVTSCEQCRNTGHVRALAACSNCHAAGCKRCYFSGQITKLVGCCPSCPRGDILKLKDHFQEEFMHQHLRIKSGGLVKVNTAALAK